MPRTALIVEVPEAEPLVAEWRAKHDWSAQHGVPAHITVLFPFVPVEHVDDVLLDELRRLFDQEPSFPFSLPRFSRFPEVVWLAPEPADAFSRLTELVFARYPKYPPYEGAHDVVVPHLTVGEGEVALQDEIDAALTPHLPIAARAEEVTMIVEDEAGRWSAGPRFPLRSGGGFRGQ